MRSKRRQQPVGRSNEAIKTTCLQLLSHLSLHAAGRGTALGRCREGRGGSVDLCFSEGHLCLYVTVKTPKVNKRETVVLRKTRGAGKSWERMRHRRGA